MAFDFGQMLQAYNVSGGQPGGVQPMQSPIGMPPVGSADKDAKNQKLSLMLYALGGALKGDKDFVKNTLALQNMQAGKKKQAETTAALKKWSTDNRDMLPPEMMDLYDALPDKNKIEFAMSLVAPQDRKIVKGADGYSYYAGTGERVLPGVVKTETTSSVSNPLRTVTKGGKVEYNIRDLDLTDEKIQEINTGGSVVQPLGFTEKFESSKDVDFAPIKSKYLATQNIIIKTSELSQKFADEPTSALAVGGVSQYVDSLIQNLDAGADLLSSAKDKKSYQYVQSTSKSLSGKDFTDAIKQASQASGVAESRIRDLGYLFAAARGQEGRGLSDKDFENALKIVSGGVGAAGRGAVLKDVSNSLREEFYRDINFDISTSENPAYVEKLQGLPELPSHIDPFMQQQTPPPATGGPRRIRRQVP